MRPSGLDARGGVDREVGGVPRVGNDDDDEGMGGSDDEGAGAGGQDESFMNEMDSGFASLSMIRVPSQGSSSSMTSASGSGSRSREATYLPYQHTQHQPTPILRTRSAFDRYSAPPALDPSLVLKPNYKLLYRTHVHLLNRFLTSRYRLSVIQTRGTPANGHMNMIYCVQLYTYPSNNRQVIFTGSRDKTIREWNLKTGEVERVLEGVHTESVLSLCARNGKLASAGSDWRVVVWDLESRGGSPGSEVVKVLRDHADSVLCVRFDDERLVSCSKGMCLCVCLGGYALTPQ